MAGLSVSGAVLVAIFTSGCAERRQVTYVPVYYTAPLPPPGSVVEPAYSYNQAYYPSAGVPAQAPPPSAYEPQPIIVTNAPAVAPSTPPPAPPPTQPAVVPGTVVQAAVAPPPPQVEVIPVAPGPAYVWVPGYWWWNRGAWIWVRGTWVARPRAGAVWVGGYWARHGHGYIWVGGHWRS